MRVRQNRCREKLNRLRAREWPSSNAAKFTREFCPKQKNCATILFFFRPDRFNQCNKIGGVADLWKCYPLLPPKFFSVAIQRDERRKRIDIELLRQNLVGRFRVGTQFRV